MTSVRLPAIASPSALALRTGVIRSPSPSTSRVGHVTDFAASTSVLCALQAARSVWITPGRARPSTASDSPIRRRPGLAMPPICKVRPMPQKVISSRTFTVPARADSSISGCTGMVAATPHSASDRTRPGCRAAVCSATIAPME